MNININIGSLSLLLTTIFVVLKLCGVISWSWWWVASPVLISIGLSLTIFLITALLALFASIIMGLSISKKGE